MPAKPLFNPVVLRQVVAELDGRGVDSAGIFRGMGFTPEMLEQDPDFLLSYRQISTVLQRALRLVLDDGLGVGVGRRRTAVGTGLAGLGWLTCGTVEEAAKFVEAHAWAFGTPLSVSVSSLAGGAVAIAAELRFQDPQLESFLVDEFFCAMASLGRGLVGPRFQPARVELTGGRPPHADELRQHLRADLVFMQPANRMVIDREMARQVPPSRDAVVMREVSRMLEGRLVQLQPSDVCATVEQVLRQQVARPPTLIQLADMLNISERTLRRKLGEQHATYQHLLDKVRQEQALRLLQQDGETLAAVSEALGFSDVRNLRRAMKRWTGSDPAWALDDAPGSRAR